MPVIAPLPPNLLKQAFELAGYRVIDEDQFSWAMAMTHDDEPFILPKKGKLVSVEIMESAMHHGTGTALHKVIFQKVQEFVAPK